MYKNLLQNVERKFSDYYTNLDIHYSISDESRFYIHIRSVSFKVLKYFFVSFYHSSPDDTYICITHVIQTDVTLYKLNENIRVFNYLHICN